MSVSTPCGPRSPPSHTGIGENSSTTALDFLQVVDLVVAGASAASLLSVRFRATGRVSLTVSTDLMGNLANSEQRPQQGPSSKTIGWWIMVE
ncbi:hypothetical protein CW362_09360 [Streptomyces populi]|uniref:Uncharacterized protein n=1 Tax=Streptomyces populi TaxID=2058924 RepID=A0A2I0STV5_9ACTN|nr:hypothetical protein CW362_09360 [Streptomyces populi]